MEESVFPLPEVSAELQHVVEARLHTDTESSPHHQRILELQKKFTGTVALPIYVIVDPQTEEIVDKLAGAGSVARFVRFVHDAVTD